MRRGGGGGGGRREIENKRQHKGLRRTRCDRLSATLSLSPAGLALLLWSKVLPSTSHHHSSRLVDVCECSRLCQLLTAIRDCGDVIHYKDVFSIPLAVFDTTVSLHDKINEPQLP